MLIANGNATQAMPCINIGKGTFKHFIVFIYLFSFFSSRFRYFTKFHNAYFRSGLYNSPVLFITGSQGSFKTVRSLATTVYNFAQYSSSLDYYSVDFNEVRGCIYLF